MESGQRRGPAVEAEGGKDISEMKKASSQPVMSTRNINGGIYEAETHDSAALRSSTGELLRPEGSSSQEATVSSLGNPTDALPHDASLSVVGEMKTRNEGSDNEENEEEMEEGEKVEGEMDEDEDYYYYHHSYNDYYAYGEGIYDYDSEEEGNAGGSTATFSPDDEEVREEETGEWVEWEDENGVNRMGAAADSPGAHYRQSDVGTLAFDRAFLYAVRHNPTGLLLFLGRYLDPQAN